MAQERLQRKQAKEQQPQQSRLINNMLAQSHRQQKALENQGSHLQAVIAVSFDLFYFLTSVCGC